MSVFKSKIQKHVSCCQQKKSAMARMPDKNKNSPLRLENFKLAGLHQWLAFLISSQSLNQL